MKKVQIPSRESIRVVPLHYPGPSLGPASLAPAKAQLTYRGGPLIQNPKVFTIFWGRTWGKTPTSTALMDRLNGFFADILVSSLLDQLAEYDVPGQAIGHG